MELREPIEWINEKLLAEFGREFSGLVRWRVVFSDDQFEKRWTDRTKDGFELLYPVVNELPKYKQFIRQRYILERLIPVIGETDLVDNISYEPAWVFQDKFGNYLPPWFDGCKFVIESVYSQMGRSGHAKYKDPLATEEAKKEQLSAMERELFGNETLVTDALAYGYGVTVPKDLEATSAPIEEAEKKG